ncbi:uncharacterized protein Dwil_GK16241 [Drosophila willistoni]|uniref:Glycosyltransferase family 92 protein n=1 Tax=Drosophila willistoni TaxID=7260 RepID=B4N1R8_DROWI|nr:uncharacterized protein LOC6644715 [Drosophila willistoni]EDW78307.2 uncharacterized protein Dwil_GK16241 [Drosophila willistoni]
MSVNRNQLFRILFVIIFLKLLFLLVLYMRSNVYINQETSMVSGKPIKVQIYDKLLIDRRGEPSLKQRLKWIRKEMPSFPLDELLNRQNLAEDPKQCGFVPHILNIRFHNDYWQTAKTKNLTYFLFGAYYDNREAVPEAPLVRLLAMIDTPSTKDYQYPKIYCQFWLKDQKEPVIVPVSSHKKMWPFGWAPERFYPHFLDCPLPEGDYKWMIPQMVSLVAKRCERGTNLLKVIYEPDEDKDKDKDDVLTSDNQNASRFVVCVKTMDFLYVDKSWRLIEWLELMRLLGVGKVVLYDGNMHTNMSRVVHHYLETNSEFVELRPMSLGRGEPHSPTHFHHYAMMDDGFNRILNEMIPYNDCFYRNMYRYDYVGVFDIDEVIMPLHNVTNWSELVELARIVPDYGGVTPENCTEWVSFCFRNVYFPRYPERPKVYKNLSSSFYMLQHVERVQQHCNRGDAAKCLHDTRFAVALHNHFTFYHTEEASCKAKSVPIAYAQLHHYREPDTKSLLINPIIDDNIWRFQPELQQRIEHKYKTLGFLPDRHKLQEIETHRRHLDEQQLKDAIIHS